jgi:peroxiredoxin
MRSALKFRVFSIIVVLILGGFSSACQRPAPPLKLKLGQRVPDLMLWDTVQKRNQRISTASGKWLILNVWATWCGPCRQELPSLDRLSRELDTEQFVVLGLSVDQDEHVLREFLLERKIQFRNYRDKNMAVANDVLGVRAFPSTFVVAPDGELKKVIEGWRYWDTPESVQEIRALNRS